MKIRPAISRSRHCSSLRERRGGCRACEEHDAYETGELSQASAIERRSGEVSHAESLCRLLGRSLPTRGRLKSEINARRGQEAVIPAWTASSWQRIKGDSDIRQPNRQVVGEALHVVAANRVELAPHFRVLDSFGRNRHAEAADQAGQ